MPIRIPIKGGRRFALYSVLLLFTGLLLATGCGSTREHRIRQYASAFAELPEARQAQVREGIIKRGATPLEVYLVHGPPDRSRDFRVPAVQPGDRWTYLGKIENGTFRSSADWIRLSSSGPLQTLILTFGPDGRVESMEMVE